MHNVTCMQLLTTDIVALIITRASWKWYQTGLLQRMHTGSTASNKCAYTYAYTCTQLRISSRTLPIFIIICWEGVKDAFTVYMCVYERVYLYTCVRACIYYQHSPASRPVLLISLKHLSGSGDESDGQCSRVVTICDGECGRRGLCCFFIGMQARPVVPPLSVQWAET